MKQLYMHEVTFSPFESKSTEGLQGLCIIYVSDKEEVEIFKAAELARKALDDGAKFQHKVLMTGYVKTEG